MLVNIRVYPVTVFIFLAAVSYVGINSVYAADYERSQTIVQTNECGNYWFPLDVLCSNLGSQTNGDENSISVASAQQQEEDKSSKTSYGPPFP
ncbi:MAG TPA: hypothetical protein VE130_10085 [Nitrososphaeraceae archaeon]|jgi:hypothetical protein|nr:hypothetical protein [Nitrososphaeraceae archaeon]